MTLAERLRRLAEALPSEDSAVTLTRGDLKALLASEYRGGEVTSRDMTVDEVAAEVGRARSTVRGWLLAGELEGYKLNGRDWRIPRSAVQRYIANQNSAQGAARPVDHEVDIGAWRDVNSYGPDSERCP